jgi:hypothetical protein
MGTSASASWECAVNQATVPSKLTLYRGATCLGEWSPEEVRRLFADGLLEPGDYYWRQGMKEWMPLRNFIILSSSPIPVLQEI